MDARNQSSSAAADSGLSTATALRLDELLQDFQAGRQHGGYRTIEEFVANHPQMADRLRNLLGTVESLEALEERHRLPAVISQSFSQHVPPQLDDFRILREIGRGGMGIVYEAEQQSLRRIVALKVLPGLFGNSQQIARFRQEAEIAARLHHSNIVPIYASGETEGYCYFAMQKIQGESLDRLEDNPHPPPGNLAGRTFADWLADVGLQVAEALHYAHQQQILHRDIKPANLLLDQNGRVWVSDFGVACALEYAATQVVGRSGTRRFQAPERLSGRCDARSEVFSLGVTLLELAVGSTAEQVGDSSGQPQPAQRVLYLQELLTEPMNRHRLPKDLTAVILKATQSDPLARYQTAAEMAGDLRRFLDGQVVAARPVNGLLRLCRWIHRNRLLAGALAAVVLLVCATAGVLLNGHLKTTRLNEELVDVNKNLVQHNFSLTRSFFAIDALLRCVSIQVSGSPEREAGVAAVNPEPVLRNLETPHIQNLLSQLIPRQIQLDLDRCQDQDQVMLAVTAPQRVGHVMFSLGYLNEAETAARYSLDLIQRVFRRPGMPYNVLHLRRAQVLNDLADIEEIRLHFPQADQMRVQSLDELDQILEIPDSRHHAYERARAHFALGNGLRNRLEPVHTLREAFHLNGPPAPRELQREAEAEQHFTLAMQFLRTERSRNDHHVSCLILTGKCLIERSRNPDASPLDRQRDFKMGIFFVEDAARRTDNTPRFLHELARCLADAPLFGWDPAVRNSEVARPFLERAHQVANQIADLNSSCPEFQITTAETCYKLAIVASHRKDHTAAVRYFTSAINIQKALIRQFPGTDRLHLTNALYHKAYATHLQQQHHPDLARQMLEVAHAELKHLSNSQDTNDLVQQAQSLVSSAIMTVAP